MEHNYQEFWEYQGYKIIECLECGFKHIDPIPDFDINPVDKYINLVKKMIQ